jgi:hypothetical protein
MVTEFATDLIENRLWLDDQAGLPLSIPGNGHGARTANTSGFSSSSVAADARPDISRAAANPVIGNIRRHKASLVVAVVFVGVAVPTPLP